MKKRERALAAAPTADAHTRAHPMACASEARAGCHKQYIRHSSTARPKGALTNDPKARRKTWTHTSRHRARATVEETGGGAGREAEEDVEEEEA